MKSVSGWKVARIEENLYSLTREIAGYNLVKRREIRG